MFILTPNNYFKEIDFPTEKIFELENQMYTLKKKR